MKHQPPKIFLRLFRWFCHPEMVDYIEGDLMEVYDQRLKNSGKRAADLKFIADVILLFRPGIIKPSQETHSLINMIMYKNYLKTGWRNLTRNRMYTAINIAGLALSMTCGILIFSLISQNLSFDNFHVNQDRIYRVVTELHRDVIGYQSNVPSPLGQHFKNDYTYAEQVARIYTENDILVTIHKGAKMDKYKEPGGVSFCEPSYFSIFNFPFLQGNASSALTNANSAVITENIARKYFGTIDAVGETLLLDNKIACTVTGVLRNLPSNTDLKNEVYVSFSTLRAYEPWLADETRGWQGIRDGMKCYLLLRPGVTPIQVEEALSPYVKKFRPNSKNVHHYKLQALSDIHFNPQYGGVMEKRKMWILAMIGVFLVATACVNFINLATAQALKRSKEVGVRKVLGSIRKQVFWQFIFETGMIAATSTLVAFILALGMTPYINSFLKTDINVNFLSGWQPVSFILVLTLAVTFLAGYYPGVVLAAFQPAAALKGRISQQTIGGLNTRRVLIVVQFAISQILIIGTIVIMNQMRFARQSDLGFDRDAIVMVQLGLDSTNTTANSLKNEIARIPGVDKISICFAPPASEDEWGNSIKIDNSQEEVNFRTSIKAADPDYLSTFSLELVAGRNLAPSDTVREMLVNETMVKKMDIGTPEEAIGHIIVANGGGMRAPIVGVLKDFHDKSLHEQISAVLITTYKEDYQYYAVKINLSATGSIVPQIEKLWLQHHPEQLFQYQFLDESIARFYESEETTLKLIQVFCCIAIFIGCLGLYGLVSFMGSQRTKEIGIRKILGGTVSNIAWLFGKEFARLILIAFCLAAPFAWWLMNNWLKQFEYKVNIDMFTFVVAIVCSVAIAVITVSYQVLKAATVNPADSLKMD